jgi:tetratricopeptide (TPR) repeat protein
MLRRTWILPCLLLAVVLAARPAVAASPEEKTKARELYQSGLVHYDLKEYAEALKSFKDAYRIVQDPAFLYNIAQCHRRLGQNPEALDFYRNYLRRSPSAPNRAEVERRIQEIEREIQQAEKTGHPPPPPPNTGVKEPPPPPPVLTPPPPPQNQPPPPAVPPPTGTTAAPPPAAVDFSAAPAPEEKSGGGVFTRWWFWATVGAVVVGGLAVGIAVSRRGEIGDCRDLTGTMCRTVGN